MKQQKEEHKLTEYGWNRQYRTDEENCTCFTGRIISQEKGLYRTITEQGELFAEVSGKFRFHANSPTDYPAVGDFVHMERKDLSANAIIHEVMQRKSVFIRKAAGKNYQEQVVAANIDIVFICMSLNRDFNLRRLERYLAVAWDSGAMPTIVLTKSDLCEDVPGAIADVSKVAMGVDVILTSNKEASGFQELRAYINTGKTAAFIGSSGVGKSTLINRLLGENRLDVNGLRNDDKGRHTTTRRELFLLPGGGMVIDTPGMRELGLWDADEGTSHSFADIEELALKCRFSDCTHTKEPDCAILAAIENGELDEARFKSYQKLKAENEYIEDTRGYLDKKNQKFKKIAQINKQSNQ